MIKKTAWLKSRGMNPYHNQALERVLMDTVAPGECRLYLWQNRRTVVIGRNQNPWRECHIARLEEDGGHLARRLSGGGAVYHDTGNLNFTFLIRKADYDVARQLEVILRAVKLLGIRAEKSGRNDLTAEGRKFSGNAFYESGDFCYHHGTLLLDTDTEEMSRYLNVAADKLAAKGVASVRARVVNLRELCPGLELAALEDALVKAFGEVYDCVPRPMEEEELAKELVAQQEAFFGDSAWRLGYHVPFTVELEDRFAWGGVSLQLHVEKGTILEAAVYSDAMEGDVIAAMGPALRGCPLEAAALKARLSALDGGRLGMDIAGLLENHL